MQVAGVEGHRGGSRGLRAPSGVHWGLTSFDPSHPSAISPEAAKMDSERQRIQEDLRGLVSGDVRCDDVFLQLYASDASIYELRPKAVVRPRTATDVSAVVKYAVETRLPVQARGAGTGLAGESLGRGIIIDFSKYMRRIFRTDKDSVRVQP